ncbi:hypothetical protein [Vibrio crassostreae]|uniref:hypothetical protein n=1 Tax=Vibrio crassostreae TaxID=246167 RepID=UPI001B317E6D|nr:hypothetical protein [Vibrio crassostreae]
MILNQPSFIALDEVPKLPRKANAFSGGLRLGSTNKYFSCDFSKKIKELRKVEEETGNTLEHYRALSVSVALYTNTFSRYHFSNDMLRLIRMVERSLQIKLNASPIGFETYFDSVKREVKSRFYFLNYNYKSDERALNGELSNDKLVELTNSVQAKVGLFENVDMTTAILSKDEPEAVESYTPTPPENADKQTQAIYELASLMGDPSFVNAAHKAMRSLDPKRARQLQSALNGLIEVNGDEFIEPIALPKKFAHQDKASNAVQKDNELLEDGTLLFT